MLSDCYPSDCDCIDWIVCAFIIYLMQPFRNSCTLFLRPKVLYITNWASAFGKQQHKIAVPSFRFDSCFGFYRTLSFYLYLSLSLSLSFALWLCSSLVGSIELSITHSIHSKSLGHHKISDGSSFFFSLSHSFIFRLNVGGCCRLWNVNCKTHCKWLYVFLKRITW